MSNKTIRERLTDLNNSLNGGATPMDTVLFNTNTVKIALGVYLLQSILLALILSIMYKTFSFWMIPMSSLLQIGWVWIELQIIGKLLISQQ